ncbi:MAG: hypothetical protein QG671_2424 [Actinomycetota bacterium]|nr:hypothetical protein [Actinomycetota bacterium]
MSKASNIAWVVTLKTGPNKWSNIMVEADTRYGAGREAQRILGNHPVVKVS